jgi:hypothetical protein
LQAAGQSGQLPMTDGRSPLEPGQAALLTAPGSN